MLLKFCEDNFLFYITHTKYFDILCVFVVLFFIALFVLTQKNEFIDKFKNNNFKMFTIIFSFGIFVGFLVFLFAWSLNKNKFEGCSTKYYQNIYSKAKNSFVQKMDKINDSKLIIVGDSRMQLINDDKEIVKPFNMEFVAKGGTKIDWLENTALPRVQRILDKNEFNYYVLVNMGVNDLDNKNYDGNEIAKDYFDIYEALARKYKEINIYILSVNPIEEKTINNYFNGNNRTNKKIKLFNKSIQDKLKENDLNNMYYCDSYNVLNFKTLDGLHYTQDTNKKIINYIVNDCVNFE